MKIDKQTYEFMKADIREVARVLNIDIKTADGGHSGLKTMYALLHKVSEDRAYSDDHPNFKSGHWKRILPYDGRDYCFYYKNDCNDAHVATALYHIKDELIKLC